MSLVLLSFLPSFSLILEFLALFLAYFFKQNKIFFLLLLILCARALSLVASEYQAHLFISVFLPFSFVLFVFLQDSKLVFERINLIKFAYLAFMGFIALILSTSTNFNASITSEIFGLSTQFFKPISELSFCVFWVGMIFLLFLYFKNNDFHFLLAYMGLSVQFLFYNNVDLGYYEFASLVLIGFLVYKAYKIAFFDTLTNLPNLKALRRYAQGLENFHLALIEVKNINEIYHQKGSKMGEFIMHEFARILKKALHARVFKDDKDYFIIVFENENIAFVQSKLQMLENFMQKYSFELKEQNAKLEIKLCLSSKNENIEESLKQAKLELRRQKD
ncbi:diguanylate cyclase [Campylobacter lari]|uniref:diguanylate cyclase domain-containing protein n=1 Tax=Campylobacter lari TaxID=201 RepID=UPI000B40242A|nr:diguanylate cyclase [Campylobacter lari]EAL0270632.1 diguanylate cyclase [Campylobacter lari]MCR6510567.1 GGDEF domain-containing protein [Campylobacter lari]MCR6527367.1 GGDEF domain-containing protein [Campylobacter lari]MCR6538074.1 GGDEF domain-containing protein [Campylobacter lari]MCR6556734.1 GGDEF domain-containing protein [Campylobacter lari]